MPVSHRRDLTACEREVTVDISQINVVYLDGTTGAVSRDVLDVLIATGKIISFQRSDGWVEIIRSAAKLRDYRQEECYTGPEKRLPWPKETNS